MSPTSKRSVESFVIRDCPDEEIVFWAFSFLSSNDDIVDEDSGITRSASELRRFPRRVTALAA